jgi:hypothetical protein
MCGRATQPECQRHRWCHRHRRTADPPLRLPGRRFRLQLWHAGYFCADCCRRGRCADATGTTWLTSRDGTCVRLKTRLAAHQAEHGWWYCVVQKVLRQNARCPNGPSARSRYLPPIALLPGVPRASGANPASGRADVNVEPGHPAAGRRRVSRSRLRSVRDRQPPAP